MKRTALAAVVFNAFFAIVLIASLVGPSTAFAIVTPTLNSIAHAADGKSAVFDILLDQEVTTNIIVTCSGTDGTKTSRVASKLVSNPKQYSGVCSPLSPGTEYLYQIFPETTISFVNLEGKFVTLGTKITNEIPTSPTNLRVTPGDQKATLSFDASQATSAGGAISYIPTAHWIDASGKATFQEYTEIKTTNVVLTGLANGTPYTFTVVAKNSKGKSAASTPSNVVTPVAAGTTNAGGTVAGGTTTPGTTTAGTAGTAGTATAGGTAGGTGDISIEFQIKNPLGETGDLNTFLANILKAIVLLLTPVVVIMMLYAGFLFVSAQGNAEKIGEAKKALLTTLAGAAIVLGAQGFAIILKNTVTCLAGAAGC
jgi:hypothetical protein